MALENRKTIAGILRWAEERGATVRFKERDSR